MTYPGFVPTNNMVTPDANGNYDYSDDPFINPTTFPFIKDPFTGSALQCKTTWAARSSLPQSIPTDHRPRQGPPAVSSRLRWSIRLARGSLRFTQLPMPPALSASTTLISFYQKAQRMARGIVRLDHNFSSKDSVFARSSYDQATNFIPGGSPTWSEATAFGSNQFINNHGRNLALSETHLFSPNTINQLNAGFSRIFNHILSFGTGTCEASIIGIPGANLGASAIP